MRTLLAALAFCALNAACVAAEPAAPSAPEVEAAEPVVEAPPPAPPPIPIELPADPASGDTAIIAPPGLSTFAAPAPGGSGLDCFGAFAQGGVALCRTWPGAEIEVDGTPRGRADAQGLAVVGFDRDAPAEATIRAALSGDAATQRVSISPRNFRIQRVDGLPQQTVTPTDPQVLARIARERDAKNVGFASRAALDGFLEGFIWPVEGRISGPWGNQRVLNGVPSTPHYGIDIAAPAGAPIRAPAAGVVSFANPDMHYEGGLVFIDHGQGLITMYLHMSRVDVAVGDAVTQGQIIGAVGATGRATGPHLCWRMKWRDRQLDPSFAILGLAAARQGLASSE